MRTIRTLLLAATLILTASPALAEDWVRVYADAERTAYCRLPAWRGPDVGAISVWTRIDYAQPQTFGSNTYRSTREFLEVDCAGMRVRVMHSIAYSLGGLAGDTVYEDRTMTGWLKIDAGSIADAVATKACAT